MRLAILSCENFEALTRVVFEQRVQNYKQKKTANEIVPKRTKGNIY